ncbi:hypothetical protein L596_024112 [Steinernema carpocapsae]|uniref:Uncharacterized protein n=1 Tax=Steinernema carpocapsae TaxID=34508 RepID=A0A4U5MFQ8_STECR|nr:hypothetical protein L596_024112 [Steinernema carpocapsae]
MAPLPNRFLLQMATQLYLLLGFVALMLSVPVILVILKGTSLRARKEFVMIIGFCLADAVCGVNYILIGFYRLDVLKESKEELLVSRHFCNTQLSQSLSILKYAFVVIAFVVLQAVFLYLLSFLTTQNDVKPDVSMICFTHESADRVFYKILQRIRISYMSTSFAFYVPIIVKLFIVNGKFQNRCIQTFSAHRNSQPSAEDAVKANGCVGDVDGYEFHPHPGRRSCLECVWIGEARDLLSPYDHDEMLLERGHLHSEVEFNKTLRFVNAYLALSSDSTFLLSSTRAINAESRNSMIHIDEESLTFLKSTIEIERSKQVTLGGMWPQEAIEPLLNFMIRPNCRVLWFANERSEIQFTFEQICAVIKRLSKAEIFGERDIQASHESIDRSWIIGEELNGVRRITIPLHVNVNLNRRTFSNFSNVRKFRIECGQERVSEVIRCSKRPAEIAKDQDDLGSLKRRRIDDCPGQMMLLSLNPVSE